MASEWIETTLGEMADFLSGGTPSKSRPDYWTGPVPWVSAKDMKRFRLEDTEGEPLEVADYRPAQLPPLLDVAGRLGVAVRWTAYVDRFLGYYAPARGEIVLCSHDLAVWFHELAHAAHHEVLRRRAEFRRGAR